MVETPGNKVDEIADRSAALTPVQPERSLPIGSESFLSRLYVVLMATPIKEHVTYQNVMDALNKGNADAKHLAGIMHKEMNDYCHEVALSTAEHFNCSLQLFDECPSTMWGCVRMASQQQIEPLQGWEVPFRGEEFRLALYKGATSVCAEYNLTINAMKAMLREQKHHEGLGS